MESLLGKLRWETSSGAVIATDVACSIAAFNRSCTSGRAGGPRLQPLPTPRTGCRDACYHSFCPLSVSHASHLLTTAGADCELQQILPIREATGVRCTRIESAVGRIISSGLKITSRLLQFFSNGMGPNGLKIAGLILKLEVLIALALEQVVGLCTHDGTSPLSRR